MGQNELKAGQTIYLKPIGNAGRRDNKIIETKIAKVGKKYFECEDSWYGRFYIDTLTQDSGEYTPNYQGYINRQEILDEIETRDLFNKVKQNFQFTNELTLEQLRQIDKIINPTT